MFLKTLLKFKTIETFLKNFYKALENKKRGVDLVFLNA